MFLFIVSSSIAFTLLQRVRSPHLPVSRVVGVWLDLLLKLAFGNSGMWCILFHRFWQLIVGECFAVYFWMCDMFSNVLQSWHLISLAV